MFATEREFQMTRKSTSKFWRTILLAGGWFFTFLAFVGLLLPLVPTTPFLLAAAACFYRSSDRFYNWIMNNRYFGHYLREYQSGRGIPMRVKILTLTFTWTSTLVSVLFFVPWLWLKIMLVTISLAVTIHLIRIKTHK
jgi:uncharacterized membrane protein YbaN (DUF454 family)